MTHTFEEGQLYRGTTGDLIYIHAVRESVGVLAYQFLDDFEATLADSTYVPSVFIRQIDHTGRWQLVDKDFRIGSWLRTRKEEINA